MTCFSLFFRVLGPTALLQLAEKKESLPSIKRPMYTQAMVGTVVVFSGFRSREDELVSLLNVFMIFVILLVYVYFVFFFVI